MSRFGLCIPCYEQGLQVEAVQLLDGDGYCRACLRTAGGGAVLAPMPELTTPSAVTLCGRGCGKVTHRGRCSGETRTLPGPPVPHAGIASEPLQPVTLPNVSKQEKRRKAPMDVLEATVIPRREMPVAKTPMRKVTGRLGDLWERLLILPPNCVLQVKNRDRHHAGSTARHIRKKAKKVGRAVSVEIHETDLFFYLEEPSGKAG